MQLSVIIVNYNVKYFLEQALLSVRKAAQGLEVEVFVVDNNSVDESVQMVRQKFPEVRLIVNKDNVGFSKANNQAIRLSTGKYVLLLNPDTVVEEDTFKACLEFMDQHPKAGGLGVKMIDGSGKFLPESKRGFPSPFAAFCKTFGLSRIFPTSKLFNNYHLGHLSEDEIHEVDVLAGAFMLMRRAVLDEVGLLDETFFMYGEDIDLSYRIQKGGYKNYYFPKTKIIHYKGESTKRGSLNYVRTFYNAMIIFAKKHFEGQQARLFVLMLQMAIYFRAAITLASNIFKKAFLPLLDAILLYAGLFYLKNFWASYHFNDPGYYNDSFLYFNAPLYVLIWLGSVYFSGGYEERNNIRRLVRGLLFGTVLIAAVYGFLDLEYRTSRALILLGAAWAVMAMVAVRTFIHFAKYGNLSVGRNRPKNYIIVGSMAESERVRSLLHKAEVVNNHIGTVAPEEVFDASIYLGGLYQLAEIVQIYKINEIIFCAKDVNNQDITHWMTTIGPSLEYKIVPQESLSVIGSSSKNTAGELYTIDIRFKIASDLNRRNKRLVDMAVSIFLLITYPIQLFLVPKPVQLLRNSWQVLIGHKSWVGYHELQEVPFHLPSIKPGILSPVDGLSISTTHTPTLQRLNLLYAKDYRVNQDLEIILKGYRKLGKATTINSNFE